MSRVDRLYAQFEARFRGPRESIVARLGVYGPLLKIVEERKPKPTAVDLGCGRGEWLQLLDRRGWVAHGIDLNESMLEEAREHGVEAELGDAIDYLAGLPGQSVDLISAFHVVEHVASERLLELLSQITRVLSANGLVILETPNPENLHVGTSTFYLDPTHEKPIPPHLLQFYVEQSGLALSRIFRVNGEIDHEPVTSLEGALRPFFFGALDYAIIASNTVDPNFAEAVGMFVDAHGQPMPVALDAVQQFDAHRQRESERQASVGESDRAQMADARADIAAVQASVQSSTHALHHAIDAVHDCVRPFNERLDGFEKTLHAHDAMRDAQGQRIEQARAEIATVEASVHSSTHALHHAIDAVHGCVLPFSERLDRFEKVLQAHDAMRDAQGQRIEQARAEIATVQASLQTTTNALHEAIVAVHNGLAPLNGQFAAFEKTIEFQEDARKADRERIENARSEIVAVQSSLHRSTQALHYAIVTVQNSVAPLDERLEGLEEIARAHDEQFEHAARTVASLSEDLAQLAHLVRAGMTEAVARLSEEFAQVAHLMRGDMTQAVATMERRLREESEASRRHASAHEERIVLVLQGLARDLKQAQDAAAEATRAAKADGERALLDAIATTRAAFQDSTSWRVTAPLRALSRFVGRGRRTRPHEVLPPVESSTQAMGDLAHSDLSIQVSAPAEPPPSGRIETAQVHTVDLVPSEDLPMDDTPTDVSPEEAVPVESKDDRVEDAVQEKVDEHGHPQKESQHAPVRGSASSDEAGPVEDLPRHARLLLERIVEARQNRGPTS